MSCLLLVFFLVMTYAQVMGCVPDHISFLSASVNCVHTAVHVLMYCSVVDNCTPGLLAV